MTRTLIRLGVLVLSAPAAAAAPMPVEVFRLDSHGHLLPPGAVARIGDYAYRSGHLIRFSFSADGRLIARSRTCGIDVREIATGKDVTPPYLRGLGGSVEFLPDGRLVHWAGWPQGCRLLDYASGRELGTINVPEI